MTDLTPTERTPTTEYLSLTPEEKVEHWIERCRVEARRNLLSGKLRQRAERKVKRREEALIALEAREKRLTEALRFYANEDNYYRQGFYDEFEHWQWTELTSTAECDGGKKAREALEM